MAYGKCIQVKVTTVLATMMHGSFLAWKNNICCFNLWETRNFVLRINIWIEEIFIFNVNISHNFSSSIMCLSMVWWCSTGTQQALCWPTSNSPISSFIGPTWRPSGADRTQVGPMLAPWTLLSGLYIYELPLRGLKHSEWYIFQWPGAPFTNTD